jgi:hypothetical protein
MTAAQLAAAYPGIPTLAVLDTQPHRQDEWKRTRIAILRMGFEPWFEASKARMRAILTGERRHIWLSCEQIRVCLAETETADFRRYVAGRLGAY